MAALQALATSSKNKIEVIISWQNVKACLCPFPSLYKVKLGEYSNLQMVLPTSRNGLYSLTEKDRLESRRIWDQIPSALSVLENTRRHCSIQGRQQTAFGSSPSVFPVPACLLDFPSCQWPGCPGHGGSVSLPSRWLHGLAFSFTRFPLLLEIHCYGGRKQSLNISWSETLLVTASAQPYQFWVQQDYLGSTKRSAFYAIPWTLPQVTWKSIFWDLRHQF